jgi:pyruvate/2-oxoglutarate dehydrogenase complex dihydrolipoamide acyltransferase (E2) component
MYSLIFISVGRARVEQFSFSKTMSDGDVVTAVVLPELPGAHATLTQWLRAEGDLLAVGDPLALVATERAEYLLPSTAEGVLRRRIAVESRLQAGEWIADVGREETGDRRQETGEEERRRQGDRETGDRGQKRRIRATPLARKIAAALGIDLSTLARRERVRKQDVLRLAELSSARRRPSTDSASDATAMPQLLTVFEVDLGQVNAYCVRRAGEFQRRCLQLDSMVCIAYVASSLLWQHPDLLSRWNEQGAVRRRRIDVVVAHGVQRTLVRDAADLTLRGFARALGAAEDVAPGDVYFSVERDLTATFLIRPAPLLGAARLWIGTEQRRAIVYQESVVVRPMAWLGLAYDAYLVDPQQANRFLASLKSRLEHFAV